MLNPFEQYKKTSVNTMTKGELLILLFDEAIKKLNQSKILLDNSDYNNASIMLEKTRKIFSHLIVTLDDNYAISKELEDMYRFFITQTIKASAMKSSEYIDDILPMIKEFRDTWAEADKITRTSKN
ncbi:MULTISPECIES: flagellar export chaperone FliS [unclassified Sedimentibacter]|uniref:flagellar export chaperone FliS n=1 Tax=unclassified Sedimentibacter TaxID=2649220 RepID=UPI0027DF9821|nr:flagellar export chaperone FliS [Sedimentibacter sp. MB35-C1]WMJ78632.1 flagellar export chaperone FliS [Sedimentibacter sp. MB35-C1]